MPTIVIASKNPVKIQAAKNGFQTLFPDWDIAAEGISVPSGVGDQPMSSAETLEGAMKRAKNAQFAVPTADYWVGIEGGIQPVAEKEMEAFAWVVVLSAQRMGKAKTASFFLPPKVVELIQDGKELGEADDIVFGKSNSKQQSGAVGLLTGDLITRTGLYEEAVKLALIPFKNLELY